MKANTVVASYHPYRTWVTITIVVILCLALPLSVSKLYPAGKIEKHTSLEKFTAGLDAYIPALMSRYHIPGVNMALIKEGQTVWLGAYGFADVEGGRRMTTDTYCRVESISKPVTAWGVMKLAEQGRIELDEPVMNYLKSWRFPESGFSAEGITVRRLLSHSAGLPLGTIGVRYAPQGDIPSLRESLSKDALVRQQPGQSFSYSNTGYNVLELLIEEVSGRDFAGYMASEVLQPLGMRHSTFVWSGDLQPAVPFGYDTRGRPVPVYVYPDKASGGLFSTIRDMAAFVAAGMTRFSRSGRKVLSDQAVRQLYEPVVKIPGIYGLAFNAYGLGYFIEILPDGRKAVSHGGQGSGWMTQFYAIPETGDGIVILTNSQRSWPFFAHILNRWAEWNGFPPVGMGRIIQGQKVLRAGIALLLLVSLGQAGRLGYDGFRGRRRYLATPIRDHIPRILFSVLLLAVLCWTAAQEYLFVSSVFPVASEWLWYTTLLFAVVNLTSVFFSSVRIKTGDRP